VAILATGATGDAAEHGESAGVVATVAGD
jgi:hypothetical protein